MPKRKSRDAAAPDSQSTPKKLRSPPSATDLSGRPKRATTQENPPTYNFTRPRSSAGSLAAKNSRSTTPASAKKLPLESQPARRGRPPKSATSAPTKREKSTKTRAPSPPKTSRPRGRPRKSVDVGSATGGNLQVATGQEECNNTAPGTSNEVAALTAANDLEEQEGDLDDDGKQYWLMKAEPESRIEKGVDVKFSIDDLRARTEPESWDGVRNYVARNNMRAMTKGDFAFFYHSNCKKPGIVGIMEIVEEHAVDETAFDPNHPYYDPKSVREKPKWDVVKVQFVRKFHEQVSLPELRSFAHSGGVLEKMQMLVQSRLSVSSVRPKEWRFIMGLIGGDAAGTQTEEAKNALDANGDHAYGMQSDQQAISVNDTVTMEQAGVDGQARPSEQEIVGEEVE